MNRTLKLLFGITGAMAAMSANAQGLGDWEFICWDGGPPAGSEDTKFYSTDYNVLYLNNNLFAASVGATGTVRMGKGCYSSAINIPVVGGLGFAIGGTGSVQDTNGDDDFLNLTMGMPSIVGGDYSYAVTYKTAGTTKTSTRFGANGLSTYIIGASDRYILAETTNDNTFVQLRVDILGDTARCQWTMTNQDATEASLGLGYGAQVALERSGSGVNSEVGSSAHRLYVTVPARKPITLMSEFNRSVSVSQAPRYPMVDYANFGWTQSSAWGLQVVNSATSPYANVPDQEPVDIFNIGARSLILGGVSASSKLPIYNFATDSVNMPNDLQFDFGIGDFLNDGVAFCQIWKPKAVSSGNNRKIVAYYRTTNAFADYARPTTLTGTASPYSVVVDPPRIVGNDPSNVYAFAKNPGVIRVYVDNVGGFTTVDKEVALNDVKVTLSLPAGIHDAANANSTTISKYINVIQPRNMASVDFNIQVDDTTFGAKPFTVTVEPNPGPAKVISGSINVATQPRLLVRNSANLVGSPWNYADTSWTTILSPLGQVNTDYQVFAWDPQQQTYVIQTSPQRGKGSFLISNVDAGFVQLGGTPSVPGDLATGSPLINLKSGWNLIANPYNYAFPLGQLVGVRGSDPRTSYTFQELSDQNAISGSLAYWDSSTQTYKFISATTDYVQPNTGYWIFVNDTQDLTLSFPAVFEPFIPAGTGGITAAQDGWNIQLISTQLNTGLTDDQTFIGYARNAKVRQVAKPPIAPLGTAISSGVPGTMGRRQVSLAKSITAGTGTQSWDYTVETKVAGQVRLTWPNIAALPKNVSVRMTEIGTNRSIDVRNSPSYTFVAKARSIRTFRFTATNVGR